MLGCTHYPFVKSVISKHIGENVKIFDGALGTANETHRRLSDKDLLAPADSQPQIEILTSGDEIAFCELLNRLLLL